MEFLRFFCEGENMPTSMQTGNLLKNGIYSLGFTFENNLSKQKGFYPKDFRFRDFLILFKDF